MNNAPDIAQDNNMPLYETRIKTPRILTEPQAQSLFNVLEDHVLSIFIHNAESADGDNWSLTMNTFGAPDIPFLHKLVCDYTTSENWDFTLTPNDFHVSLIEEKNWLEEVHRNFPPVQAGRFFVYGSHYDGDIPNGFIPLKIDAATAFGSGEHETTKGCLLAFEELAKINKPFKNGLDMGCGSGILAIGMAKIWHNMHVTAVDIDPESIDVSIRHADMNDTPHIAFETGDGYHAPIVAKNGSYDLIVANILANPLIDMAPDLNKYLAKGGFCVLAGLLQRQEADVLKAHIDQGLKHISTNHIGEWSILVLQSV